MIVYDQLLRKLEFDAFPNRIVSLVPSLSELIWDLGLQEQLVGITKFCIHPEEMHNTILRVGGTKNPSIEKIRHLKPDLIVANKEENTLETISQLEKEFNVYVSDVNDLNSAYQMISDLGKICNRSNESFMLNKSIQSEFDKIIKVKNLRIVYLIWKNPLMCVGGSNFINSLLQELGLENCFSEIHRYPSISLEDIKKTKPDFLFLSSEPYPFTSSDFIDFKSQMPDLKMILVNGEYFSWYGSRMKKAATYFNSLLDEIKKASKKEA